MNHQERVELISRAYLSEAIALIARGDSVHSAAISMSFTAREGAGAFTTAMKEGMQKRLHEEGFWRWAAMLFKYWIYANKKKGYLMDLIVAGCELGNASMYSLSSRDVRLMAIERTAGMGLTLNSALVTIAEDMLQEAGL